MAKRLILLSVALVLVLVPAGTARKTFAQACTADAEPNGQPALAQALSACAEGTLTDQDADFFRFTVPSGQDAQAFSLKLGGVAGALTKVQILRDRGADAPLGLYTLTSPRGEEALSEELLLAAGDYYAAVFSSGGLGTYRLDLLPGSKPPASGDREPNDLLEQATKVAAAFSLSGALASDYDSYAWTLSAAEAGKSWSLAAQAALGRRIDAALFDATGTLLARRAADAAGRAAFSGLWLPAGTYLLTLSGDGSPGNAYRLAAAPEAAADPWAEAEPNDGPAQATPWTTAEPAEGRLYGSGDLDLYRISLGQAAAGSRFDLHLRSTSRAQRTFCLKQADDTLLQCRSGAGELVLSDLALEPGDYLLSVGGEGDPAEQYTLSQGAAGSLEAGQETEPNDTYRLATPLGAGNRAWGRFAGYDIDYYRFEAGEAQLWRIQVVGDSIEGVRLVDAAGIDEQVVAARSQGRVRLNGVYLLPGTHYIAASGRDADYRVMAVPLGAPPAGAEREPNDAPAQANPLLPGVERTGLLGEAGDADGYRFTLPAEEHVRLTVTPPEDAILTAALLWDEGFAVARYEGSAVGAAPYVLDTVLPPGDYRVSLSASRPGDAPYRVKLELRDPFETVVDREPNNTPDLAGPVPADLEIKGSAAWTDPDWYLLPELKADTAVTLSAPTAVSVSVYDHNGASQDGRFSRDAAGVYQGALTASASQPYRLVVTGNGSYTVKLSFARGPAAAPAPAAPPIKMTPALGAGRVAAFWPAGQEVSGKLTLENSGAQPLALALDAHSGHPKIEAVLAQLQVTVSARGRLEVPLTLLAASDLPTGDHYVTWRARTAAGGQVTAASVLSAAPDAPVESPRRAWLLPDALLGGLDAAATALGAQVVTPDAGLAGRQAVLHDGYTTLADAFQAYADALPLELTVKLAGESAVPVSGILLNPQSAGPQYEKLKDFEVWLSADGSSYKLAMTGALSPALAEQAFALPAPIQARYARLRLLSNQVGRTGQVSLGEWKVVASPGTALVPSIDLVAPQNGGHLVLVRPQSFSADGAWGMLRQDGKAARLILKAGSAAEWVIGFHHGRAAQVAAVQWVNASDAAAAERVAQVEVSASLAGAAGPWTSLGQWKLAAGESTFTLPAPVWARYLRLATDPAAQEATLAAPDVLRVVERAADAGYRSILAEWGHYSREGPYEWLTPPEPAPGAAARAGNTSAAAALALAPGTAVQGAVQLGQGVAWYRIDLPAGQNAVVLRLTGQPTVGVSAAFQDAEGRPLPATVEAESPSERIITARAQGGSSVYVRIEEPPRSVVFAWDESGSMSLYRNMIYGAVSFFVEGVAPGREVANLLPFGGGPLLVAWGEGPVDLQRALNDYDRSRSSSNAEEALLAAVKALSFRQGSKAVVLITDAESEGYPLTEELWDALQVVQPRVFATHVNSHVTLGDLPASPQDLMQSWAAVNAGYYDFLRTVADLEVAFARAAAWLRRPAAFGLIAETAALPPPAPGTLTVLSSLSGEDSTARGVLLGDTAVEIILDASGSMLEKLGDSTRIAVAKATLDNLLDTVLPAGIPFALRAFGNREANSCRTDLEMPLAPLDAAAVKAVVAGILPNKQGATPIAASLLKVGEDLKDAGPGVKLVILLTDGEESCKGDPAASIAALKKQGIDVRLNIVGFMVTDKKLQQKMAGWASAGGGQFLAAADQAALASALAEALRVPYRVVDGDGKVVAQGLVDGAAVELPAGVYRVEVLTNPVQVLENVSVGSGQDTVLRVTAVQ